MNRRVLVVEDDSTARYVARRAIERLGYVVVEATNGMEALYFLRDRPDFALVLTDVAMPRLSGPELIREMRADPRLAAIPVVQVTARLDFVDWQVPALTKPCGPDEMMSLVRAYARRPS